MGRYLDMAHAALERAHEMAPLQVATAGQLSESFADALAEINRRWQPGIFTWAGECAPDLIEVLYFEERELDRLWRNYLAHHDGIEDFDAAVDTYKTAALAIASGFQAAKNEEELRCDGNIDPELDENTR